MTETGKPKQLLHLVFGGELENLQDVQFRDLNALDIVGIYPDYASALTAWKSKAQMTVDNAHMRYFIVHMHRLSIPTIKFESFCPCVVILLGEGGPTCDSCLRRQDTVLRHEKM